MKEHWYPLTIAESRISNIKYAAAYITMPQSCISHYAEVQLIDQMPGSSKYRIVFKPNSIKVLPNILKSMGRKDAIRARRYTHLSKLLSATSISQLK